MEEIVIRFPVIAQQILEQLDNQNLTKCRTVDKIICSSIDKNRLIWTRMIKNDIRKSWKIGDGESASQTFRGPGIDNSETWT